MGGKLRDVAIEPRGDTVYARPVSACSGSFEAGGIRRGQRESPLGGEGEVGGDRARLPTREPGHARSIAGPMPYGITLVESRV